VKITNIVSNIFNFAKGVGRSILCPFVLNNCDTNRSNTALYIANFQLFLSNNSGPCVTLVCHVFRVSVSNEMMNHPHVFCSAIR